MVKTKNNSTMVNSNPTEVRPTKKAKITDAVMSTGEDEEVQERLNDNTDTNTEQPVSQEKSTVVVGEQTAKIHSPEIPTREHGLTPTPSTSTTTSKRGSGATQATLAVKTVIPHPTNQLMDDIEVKDYNKALKFRLQKLSEYCNAKANIYALGKLLPSATWGPYKPINDRSKVLCDPATGEPLTIWVVGHIAKMWFAKRGKPENQAAMTILPLSQELAKQSGTLLAKFSSPMLSLNQQTTDIIRAIKWQNTKDDNEAILFDAVYDVREDGSLKTYSERPI
ncbi:hypothetical protein EDB19DRAFT_1917205 [Suillus lakei]|nr:hypothetical protein EDB19DRAFT_1917205 [Suillus lakei]